MTPKVSVIMPVYNVEKYLRECLSSVVNQTLKDIEIICVNDGSCDNCLEIIEQYAANDCRIQIINKENGGYGSACNAGLKAASGRYVAIIEPDDFVSLDMYEKLYNLAVRHDVDIVKSCFYENYDTPHYKKAKKTRWKDKLGMSEKVFNIYEHPEFLYFHPSIWSCIYRREFIETHDICFSEAKGAGWSDNPFQVQTMCLAKSIFYTDEAYYYWRKQNLDGAKDLKDYTVPFKRSDEIHAWLEAHNIKDENILRNLHKREKTYIETALKVLKFEDLKNADVLIGKMLERMKLKAPNIYFEWIKRQFNIMCKMFISVRWSKYEHSLVLLGRKKDFIK